MLMEKSTCLSFHGLGITTYVMHASESLGLPFRNATYSRSPHLAPLTEAPRVLSAFPVILSV